MTERYYLTRKDRDTLRRIIRDFSAVDRLKHDPLPPASSKTTFISPLPGTSIPGITWDDVNDKWVPGKGKAHVYHLLPDYTDEEVARFEKVIISGEGEGAVYREVDVWNSSYFEVFYPQFVKMRKSRHGVAYIEDPPVANWLARVPVGGIPAESFADCELWYNEKDGTLKRLETAPEEGSPEPILRRVHHLGPQDISFTAGSPPASGNDYRNLIQTKMNPVGELIVDVNYC